MQVTNLGITVKDSPQNTLVFVTRLDTGAPVAGATRVDRPDDDQHVLARNDRRRRRRDRAPKTPLRDPDDWWRFSFIVTAEKDGDIAYVGSDWNEGILPWDFGTNVNLRERDPLLRGSVFTDRGVYRLGEEVHLKAILRHNTPTGIRLLPDDTPVSDHRPRRPEPARRRARGPLTPWSSAEWTMKLPDDGTLGDYSLRAILEADTPTPKAPENRQPGVTPSPDDDDAVPDEKAVRGSFLVAAYRRPDFRVDVSLTGDNAIAGGLLKGVVTGALSLRRFDGRAAGDVALLEVTGVNGAGGDHREVQRRSLGVRRLVVRRGRSAGVRRYSPRRGHAARPPAICRLSLETRRDAGMPYIYSLEGDVEDVSRQHIANRASVTVHPAPWYVGLRRPSVLPRAEDRLEDRGRRRAASTAPPCRGLPVDVTLTQVQWTSVRRAEGNGFYTWDTQRRDIDGGIVDRHDGRRAGAARYPAARTAATTSSRRAAREDDGRFAVTRTSFYVLGEGYTAWARFDHNRIELVPERQTYRPGDTARIMIQSPWEQATALVTTEREGIRSHRQFALTSTQQSVSIPIDRRRHPQRLRLGAARQGTHERRARERGGHRVHLRHERSR